MDKIIDLASVYKFHDYRFYRQLNQKELREYLYNQILDTLQQENDWVLIAKDKEEIVGLVTLNFLPWDTKHFKIKMAKIGYLIARGDYDKSLLIKNALVTSLLNLCRNEKIKHLSSRVDIGDISSIHALEKNKFKFMDTLVTYVFNKAKHSIPELKDLYKVRPFQEGDLNALLALAKISFTEDHFHRDSCMPKEKTDTLFSEWVKNSCLNRMGEKVLVAENRSSEAVGFLLYELDKELSKFTNCKIIGHGLSAVSPTANGAYPGLVKATVKDVIANYDYADFDTQLTNYRVIKVYQKFGFNFVRAKHTFHHWL